MKNQSKNPLLDQYLQEYSCFPMGKEERDWLDITPVGREFGSSDYERLVTLDNLVFSAKNADSPASLALRVFLDDERATPEGWVRVYWPDEAIDLLETNAVAEISLDHDLGNDERGTGYDVVLWIEEAVALRGFTPPKMNVHSANSSAREKMEAGIQAIHRLAKKMD